MRSASVIRRVDKLIIHPWSKAVSGLGLGTPPFIVLQGKAEPEQVGQAIIRALDANQTGLPHPAPDEWSKCDAPLYAAAGVKSWSAFVKGSVTSTIVEHETHLEFAPLLNMGSRNGFQDVGIESITIPRDSSHSEIGEAAIQSLERAKAAESNPPPKKKIMPAQGEEPHEIEASLQPHASGNGAFLKKMEERGFFRYTDPVRLAQERAAILEQGWSGIFGENGRWFFADAEDLAEGGVSAFIAEITPFLEEQGVKLPPLEDEFDLDQHYTLIASEERFPIWSRHEYEKEADRPGILWGTSAVRTVQIVNNMLERVGSAERAYGVNGGNDFAVFFLTPELYDRILQEAGASAHDGPYVPNLEYPSFGQPRKIVS